MRLTNHFLTRRFDDICHDLLKGEYTRTELRSSEGAWAHVWQNSETCFYMLFAQFNGIWRCVHCVCVGKIPYWAQDSLSEHKINLYE